MAQIIPAILAYNEKEFNERLKFLRPHFSLIQVDIIDLSFAKKKSYYNPSLIHPSSLHELPPSPRLRRTSRRAGGLDAKAKLELHMMVENPKTLLTKWLKLSKVKRVIVHYESFTSEKGIYDIISSVKRAKKELGIALNPKTPLSVLRPFGKLIDEVLIMGIVPGKSGQKLIPSTLNKVKQARKLYPKLKIGVDGGVNSSNIFKLVKAGANIINSASLIYSMNIRQIKNLKTKLITACPPKLEERRRDN